MTTGVQCLKVELTNGDGFPRRITVASGTAIAIGSILSLTDPRTGAQSATDGETISGIVWPAAKSATDGATTVSVVTDGIFKGSASGAIIVGAPVLSAGHDNFLRNVTTDASGAQVIGYSLEEVADTETFQFRLRL